LEELNVKKEPHLERRLGLWQASSLNMINMVGIGPFVVVPVIFNIMGGHNVLLPWIAGAIIAILDSFIWAELGAKYPLAGGTYNFLREAYKDRGLGRFMSFLFICQIMVQAPLVIASGAIGFSQYFSYIFPLPVIGQKAVSGLVVIALTALLYRKIQDIGKISILLWIGVIGTIVWLIFGGMTHFNTELFMSAAKFDGRLSALFFAALGHASVQTIYCFLGYYNVCQVGGETKTPEKTIPRSMFISVAGITVLYLLLNISIAGVIPAQSAMQSKFIVSNFVETLYGKNAATVTTLLILWITFASLFSVMLGYSRVPYAAAKDGNFFKAFARIHPEKHFPHISLLVLGSIAFVFSLLFRLREVIEAIIAMRILVQFVGQAVGLMMLRKSRPKEEFPFKMFLYPIPVIVSIIFWLLVFYSTGPGFMLSGIAMIAISTGLFFLRKALRKNTVT
jgi:fructoselysine transporter